MGNLIAWIITGLLAGLLARWVVKDDRRGCLYTTAIGVLGALVGGALMHAVGDDEGLDAFSWKALGVSALGAILLLLVLQALAGRGPRRR